MAEMALERGLLIHPSCIWRWVQAYAPELNKRCRHHLKPTNKSYRTDETYIKVKGKDQYLYRAVDSTGQTIDFLLTAKRDAAAAKRFFRKALRSPGNPVPRGHQRGQESSVSSSGGSAERRRCSTSSGSSTAAQLSQQCSGTGSSDGEEADVAGERLWVVFYGMANVTRNRSREHDPERASEMGGKAGPNRAGHIY